jgi:stage II sporulation protein D
VLTGSYTSQKEAEAGIAALSGKLSGYGFETAELSGRYIAVLLDGISQFVFDTASGSLNFRPAGDGSGTGGSAGSGDGVGAGAVQPVYVNDRAYRGYIEVLRPPQSDMTVVNVLSMNEYLYGVVPREIEASSHEEALKAQAVAARTYAVTSTGKHRDLKFEICNTVDCQVYGGVSGEHANTTKAVVDTTGKIVTWQGSPALVFYFSSSGGYTEDVKNVWGSNYPYLISVEDKYESGKSYMYNWETTYTAKQIKDHLSASGADIGDVKSVSVTKMSAAGRAVEVTVVGSKDTKKYTNESCRYFLKNLYSQMYNIRATGGGGAAMNVSTVNGSGTRSQIDITGKTAVSAEGVTSLPASKGGLVVESGSGKSAFPTSGDTYIFSGKGWGHGVGMSQEGAKGMALQGYKYDEILKHYFPGCEVE